MTAYGDANSRSANLSYEIRASFTNAGIRYVVLRDGRLVSENGLARQWLTHDAALDWITQQQGEPSCDTCV